MLQILAGLAIGDCTSPIEEDLATALGNHLGQWFLCILQVELCEANIHVKVYHTNMNHAPSVAENWKT